MDYVSKVVGSSLPSLCGQVEERPPFPPFPSQVLMGHSAVVNSAMFSWDGRLTLVVRAMIRVMFVAGELPTQRFLLITCAFLAGLGWTGYGRSAFLGTKNTDDLNLDTAWTVGGGNYCIHLRYLVFTSPTHFQKQLYAVPT